MKTSAEVGSARESILIVDDNPDNLSVMEKVIQKDLPEVTIVTCQHATHAQELMRENDFALAVIDVQMPIMNGLELCEQIKSDAATRSVAVILITSHESDPATKARGMELGAGDFIMRPLNNKELVARVKVGLRTHQAAAELRSEARHTAAELDASDLTLRAMFDNTRDGILLVDIASQRVHSANPAMCDMMGYTPSEMTDLSVPELHPEEQLASIAKAFEQQITGEKPLAADVLMKRKDGSVFSVDINSSPVELESKAYLLGIFRDITKRKLAEKKLAASEKRSRAWLSNSPVCSKILDLDLNLQYMSDAGVAALKVEDVATYYGKPYPLDFFPDEFKRAMSKSLEEVKRTGELIRMDGRLCDTEGNELWFDHIVLPVNDDEGHLDYIMVVSMDTTKRVEAENALRDSYEYLGQIINTIGDPVFVKDESCRFVLANDALCTLLETSREKLLGTTAMEFLPDDQMDHFQAVDRAVLSSGEENLCEESLTGGDGNIRTIVTKKTRYIDGGGTKFVVGIIRDITERKLAEEERHVLEAQLRQSQKLESIGTLASGVAHEINNPVMGIMNYAQLIQDGLAPGDELAGFAAEISKETDRVITIVKDLLSFARNDDSPRSPARMCSIVESTMSLVRALLRQDQITLDVAVPEDLPLIECRSQQIQQVVMNLLANARDALNEKYAECDDNKKISVTSCLLEEGGRQRIRTTIEDHGLGIPEDIRERMFDPFYTTKPRDKGTGLGLSMSHGIVTEHGGELSVETEIGEWTRFHMDLPVDNDLTDTDAEVST